MALAQGKSWSAFGGLNDVLTTTSRVQVWGGVPVLVLGLSVLVCSAVIHTVYGHLVWPFVGFAVTATYLSTLAVQYWVASRGPRM